MNRINVLCCIALFNFTIAITAGENLSNSILLVIDMQKDLLTPGKAGMKMSSSEIDSLIIHVNENIAAADSLNIPVAYIQNVWTNPLWIFFAGNICRKGDPETDFDQRLLRVHSQRYEKSAPNVFSNKELDEFVNKNKIKNIFICGIKSEGCVGATVKSSLKKGYTTFLIAPAIGSNSQKRLMADITKLEKSGAVNTVNVRDQFNQ